ncbi:lytic transglycosylase domain-containing protein [Streptomyces sp. NPDC015131]|uniref:lytic transglycosylase domain-containing protein n=1 Tax=Streptomyces sp. NPDC015131 TaxID=3364941 RepID=UPI0036F5DD85
MAPALQRATQGFTAVAVAATLVTVGTAAYERRNPPPPPAYTATGTQAVPRPFTAPSLPATPPPGPSPTGDPGGTPLPANVHRAYLNAEAAVARSQPACRLRWQVLAGIGQVESGQAHGGALAPDGTTLEPIVGPVLDGSHGFAAVPDTDRGRLDGDSRWDRAVGPLQFLPATWATWGTDGNGDGTASPHNMYDAALTAGRYLCAGDRDLSDPRQLRAAILSYNRSDAYADTVLQWIDRYSGVPAPAPTGGPPSPPTPSTPPPPSPSSPAGQPPARRPDDPHRPSRTPSSPSTGSSPSPTGSPTTSPSPSPSPSATETGTGTGRGTA